MPKCLCRCGAKYNVAEKSVGKSAKCKKCGEVFTLEPVDEGIIPFADDAITDGPMAGDMGVAGEVANASQRASLTAAGGSAAGFDPSTLPPVIIERAAHPADETTETTTTYLRSVFATFLFLSSLHNALTFAVLWVAYSVAMLVLTGGFLGFGLFAILRFGAYLAFLGWWAAFRFNVVASGAAGEDDLPDLNGMGDGFMDFFMIFLQWIGSWFVVLMPAFGFLIVAFTMDWLDPDDFTGNLDAGLAGLLSSGSGSGAMVFGGLVILGVFFWPIIILCTALGGLGCVRRIDLIVTTIVKTFGAYLFTVMMVFAIGYLGVVMAGFVDARFSADEDADISSSLGSMFVISFFVYGITIYCEIVAMKLIGLYYHHFKHKFAWNWG